MGIHLDRYMDRHVLRVLLTGLFSLAVFTFLNMPLVHAQEPIVYEVRFEGVADPAFLETLQSLSDVVNMQEDAPASLLHLRRRATRDEERFLKALNANAYYGGSVSTEILEERSPVIIIFKIAPGEQYVLRRAEIVRDDAKTPIAVELPAPETLGLVVGKPALAAPIVAVEDQLLRFLRDRGFPQPSIVDRDVLVDHATKEAFVTYRLDTGPHAVFGPVAIEGLEKVQERVVLQHLAWKPGEVFSREKLEETQNAIYRSGLFSSVRVETGEEVNAAGEVPVQLKLAERKHRTVSAGLEYRSDEGPAARFRWEHRNMRGLGRRLTLESTLSSQIYQLRADYFRSYFRRPEQSLRYELEIAEEDTDAFTSSRISSNVWVDRQVTERLSLGLGLGLRLSEVEQLGKQETYQLLSVPLQLKWDGSDDPLNPTTGLRVRVQVAPYVDIFGSDTRFIKTELNVSHYWQMGGNPDWILATRARLGSILSYEIEHVPPDVRFYAGGGGSVRGFPYQKVGPILDGDPVGGRSVIEGAVELRRRITKQIGLAVFVDGGMVYAPSVPDFEANPRFGAGIGIRYFTPIGPIRFDIATPINPSDDVDERVQFYISIGQSF